MSSTPRAGEKRRNIGRNDGYSAVPVKIDSRCSSSSSSYTSSWSRNSLPESLTEVTDVETLYTAADLQAQLELKARQVRSQCVDEYEAKILDLEAKHTAKAIQQNQRHVDEKADLYAEISSMKAKLKAVLDAQLVKPEPVDVLGEQTFGQTVEEFVDEKLKLNQDVADKGEKIIALTSTVAELVTRVANAERDKDTAQKYYRQCRLKIEELENEVRSLKAASQSATGPPAPATTSATASSSTKIYVGSLLPAITDDALKQYCSQFGRILHLGIIRTPGHTFCYGFVRFSTPEEACKALASRVHSIDGQEFHMARTYR